MAKKTAFGEKIPQYYSDLNIKRALNAVFLRSSVCSGKIEGIGIPDLPGGYSFFSAKNVQGENAIKIDSRKLTIFADSAVEYFGQPIGILVGGDSDELNSLMQNFCVRYFDVSDGFDYCDDSLPDDEKFRFLMARAKCLFTKSFGDAEEIQKMTAESQPGFYSLRFPHRFLEPAGAIASFDDGTMHIYAPIRWAAMTRRIVAAATGLNECNIAIHSTASDSYPASFYSNIAVLSAQLAVVSMELKRPVKYVCNHREMSEFYSREPKAVVSLACKTDDDMSSKAMKITLVADCGCDMSLFSLIAERIFDEYLAFQPSSNISFEIYAAKTPFAATNANPFWISSLLKYAVNLHFFRIIDERGFDAAVFYEKRHALPNYTDELFEKSDFLRKRCAYKMPNSCGGIAASKRGIAFAFGVEGCGFFSPADAAYFSLEVCMEKNGEIIVRFHRLSSNIIPAWRKIVSDFFSVDPKNVKFVETLCGNEFSLDCDIFPEFFGVMTNLLLKACTTLKKSLFVHPLPMTVKKRLSLARKNVKTADMQKSYISLSSAMAVCEVEIDPVLLTPVLRGLWILIDAGKSEIARHFFTYISVFVEQVVKMRFDCSRIDFSKISINFVESSNQPSDVENVISGIVEAAIDAAVLQAFGTKR